MPRNSPHPWSCCLTVELQQFGLNCFWLILHLGTAELVAQGSFNGLWTPRALGCDPFSSAIPPSGVTGGHGPGAGAWCSSEQSGYPILGRCFIPEPFQNAQRANSPCPALFLLPVFPSSFVEAAQPELPELWVSGPELELPMGSVLSVTVQDSHVPSPSPVS